jgi:hypothetical protein
MKVKPLLTVSFVVLDAIATIGVERGNRRKPSYSCHSEMYGMWHFRAHVLKRIGYEYLILTG